MSSCNATLALLASRRSTSHTLTQQQQQQQLPLRRFASCASAVVFCAVLLFLSGRARCRSPLVSFAVPAHEMMGLPALSPTMEKGNLVAWRKKEGDKIKAGEIIAEIETDKAVMEFEAQDNAVLAKILVQAGTNDLAVGTVSFGAPLAAPRAALSNSPSSLGRSRSPLRSRMPPTWLRLPTPRRRRRRRQRRLRPPSLRRRRRRHRRQRQRRRRQPRAAAAARCRPALR